MVVKINSFVKNRLLIIGWLVDLLVSWLVGWLVGWLDGRSVGRSVGIQLRYKPFRMIQTVLNKSRNAVLVVDF